MEMLKSGIGLVFTAGFLVTNKFDRIVKARDLAIKRSIVEEAQEQFRSKQPEVASVPIPPQPSEKDRKGHEMTHTPFQPWCKFCVMSRSLANQHPHVADHAQDAQREHPTVQCDFFVMEAGKEDAVFMPTDSLPSHKSGSLGWGAVVWDKNVIGIST